MLRFNESTEVGKRLKNDTHKILDWLSGMIQFDAIAEWAWTVFETMFESGERGRGVSQVVPVVR